MYINVTTAMTSLRGRKIEILYHQEANSLQYMSEKFYNNKISEYSYNISAWQSNYKASNRKRTKFKKKESYKTSIERIWQQITIKNIL